MPADTFERTSPSSVAATPGSLDSTPEKARTTSENRKSSKPIMEKRRRARINESLGQLKTLILDALKKDSSRHSKLEKADILEMTVKHLRNLQRLQMTAVNTNPGAMGKYRAGFSECVAEVTRFLSTCEGVNADIRTRLLGHLATCVSQINVVNFNTQRQGSIYTSSHPSQPGHVQAGVQQLNRLPCKSAPVMNISPDAVKLYGGVQVVPTTEGQFAFVIPSTALAPLSFQNCHPATLVSAMSPVAPPPIISDSVWRPW